ncbi:hypothetical protein G7Z17_g2705 [Cylindrodendrum hubeiense]|uniref:Uncharacterized protein n=1 Tax=Cylindrodendrum hubeiense TaxID=595255 RepID=A0A9P5HJ94_9HYPO|nr:hypothetical protein G7Z17_g2705 [Cylindrodendrum hubeiense]
MAQDSLSLSGKVAIITGSGKENGIGAGIALALARAGAKVTINYVSPSTAERTVKTVDIIETAAGKDSVLVIQADISTPEGNEKLVKGTLKGFNVDHIDIIGVYNIHLTESMELMFAVNNASWVYFGPALAASTADLHQAFGTGVFGPLYLLQAAMPYMSKGGRVINIGSIASKLGLREGPIYASVKGAMDALTFSLAHEIGRAGKGLTINTVAPGPVLTDMLSMDDPDTEAFTKYLVSLTRAEDRLGTVEDIADTVLLLVSEKGRWITGQHISASGGITGG